MDKDQQIAHWKERALRAERAIDDLYCRARDYAAPVGSGRIMIEGFGSVAAKIQTIKAIRDCTGSGLKDCAKIANDLPQIVIDRDGRFAKSLREIAGVEWHRA